MSQTAGRTELFRREAADRLRELMAALATGTVPELPPLQRSARGLRGIATLAGPASYATAARRLEAAIARLVAGEVAWATTAPVLRGALRELTALAGLAATWGAQQDGEAAAVTTELDGLLETRPIVPIAALAPPASPPSPEILPIESLAPDPSGITEPSIVPIAALAPDDATIPAPALPPLPLGGPAPIPERTRLEQALSSYSRLVAANAPAALLGSLIPPAVPPLRSEAPPPAPAASAAGAPVPIDALLYRGAAALARAAAVREELDHTFRNGSTTLRGVEPLVRELLDLVQLALSRDA